MPLFETRAVTMKRRLPFPACRAWPLSARHFREASDSKRVMDESEKTELIKRAVARTVGSASTLLLPHCYI